MKKKRNYKKEANGNSGVESITEMKNSLEGPTSLKESVKWKLD